jgi:hypothetical protein
MLALCVALTQAQESIDKPLVSLPLHKDGEHYAMLDFFSADPVHIRATAAAFCEDHGFSNGDLQAIVSHAQNELNKVMSQQAQLPPVNGVSGQGPPQPAKGSASLLLAQFMKANGLTAAQVLHALADTLI